MKNLHWAFVAFVLFVMPIEEKCAKCKKPKSTRMVAGQVVGKLALSE
jgi:hypothetical protein